MLLKKLFPKSIDSSSVGPHYKRTYINAVSALLKTHDRDEAMSLSVGGQFEKFGILEYCLLLDKGLKENHTLIDVGCGSGRLAVQLVPYLKGKYIGLDVVPDLVSYAQEICGRHDWQFSVAPGLQIPAEDGCADMVCFFSVLTHLRHDESYRYLQETTRVLKPGGRAVVSFLEFAMPSHWDIFEATIANTSPDPILNQFISRKALEVWADKLGLEIQEFEDGDKPFIPVPEAIREQNDFDFDEFSAFGQSVCVLRKPE